MSKEVAGRRAPRRGGALESDQSELGHSVNSALALPRWERELSGAASGGCRVQGAAAAALRVWNSQPGLLLYLEHHKQRFEAQERAPLCLPTPCTKQVSVRGQLVALSSPA